MQRKIYLKNLALKNYRNLKSFELQDLPSSPVVILGANGSGKTNILEALSYFAPGRGLRGARFDELIPHNQDLSNNDFCSISVLCEGKLGGARLESCLSGTTSKRNLLYNGSKIATNELTKFIDIMWLTPQMDGIFAGSSVNRRKLLDRLVYNFDSTHAQRINKYDYYLHERLKIILNSPYSCYDEGWIGIVENNIASIAESVATSRLAVIKLLNAALYHIPIDLPKTEFSIVGELENNILGMDAESITEYIKGQLRNNRTRDHKLKRCTFGTHRSDLLALNVEKNIEARFCSTGEQKSMLIALIIAAVNALIEKRNTTPILLLDELFVHLDDQRKEQLSSYILKRQIQAFITATDDSGLKRLASEAFVVHLETH